MTQPRMLTGIGQRTGTVLVPTAAEPGFDDYYTTWFAASRPAPGVEYHIGPVVREAGVRKQRRVWATLGKPTGRVVAPSCDFEAHNDALPWGEEVEGPSIPEALAAAGVAGLTCCSPGNRYLSAVTWLTDRPEDLPLLTRAVRAAEVAIIAAGYHVADQRRAGIAAACAVMGVTPRTEPGE